MGGFEDVDHLVDDDVFQAGLWFLGELGVQPDGSGFAVAAAPSCFHPLNE